MNNKVTKKSSEVAPTTSKSGLVSSDEFDIYFDDFLTRRWPRLASWNFPFMGSEGGFPSMGLEKGFPKVDIIEHEDEIEVQAALPGVKKEDVDVTINNQAITIRTSTKKEKEEKGKYFRREITRGEFQRTLSLPDYVDYDNAKAVFKDGILKVTIPKTAKAKRKNIEIK